SARDDEAWSVDKERLRFPARVAVIARDSGRLANIADDERWLPLIADSDARPWTDDYSNILGALVRKLMQGDGG
ncbi:MAG: hypothetical protein ACTSP2_07785, partial [Alphaproteobacteria bacterium]